MSETINFGGYEVTRNEYRLMLGLSVAILAAQFIQVMLHAV